MDIIKLIYINLNVITGVESHERLSKTLITLNITIFCSLKDAGVSDDLNLTVDYKKIEDALVDKILNKEFLLIEKIAEDAATVVLSFDKVKKVYVEVEKKGTLDYTESAIVAIERS
jgi:dihydroneopterin aldolase